MKRDKATERGSIMIAAVIALIIMLVTGLAVLQLARSGLKVTSASKERTVAQQAAEAGTDFAIAQLELHPGEWSNIVQTHPDWFQNHSVGDGSFTVDPITWTGRVARIVSKGKAHQGGRVVSIVRTVRMLPAGWRYALFADGNIAATGNASVYGSIHSNANIDPAGAGITVGGSFAYTAEYPTDLVESYGNIYDSKGLIPDVYEYPQANYVPVPPIDWAAFQNPQNFPGVTVYNTRQADATHPTGTVVKEADGSYSYYWAPTQDKKGAYNIDVNTSDFNTWFAPRDGNTKVVVNWLAGTPAGGGYDYKLHFSGQGTITATLVCPAINGSKSSVQLDGGIVWAPTTGVAILTESVDMSKVNGHCQLGTETNPALVFAGGGATFSANGTMDSQGSVVVGGSGSSAPDIDIKGNATFHWNPGFINKLPEEWQGYFGPSSSRTLPLIWQQLGAEA